MKTVRMMLSLACIGLLPANSALAQEPGARQAGRIDPDDRCE